ncbi:DMT family transporter [Tepidiphilus sp. J10]|uniref:DMT family transporter n=1 Tax=Tepidiphilus sp. J10 TaxID=2502185 RepID=UPI00115D8D13|nr:DMT family transporter [Tepidiphilus sp. J10]
MRLSPVAGEATLPVYLKLVAAMLSWGGTWVAGRVVAQAVGTPIAAAAARFTLAALVLGAVLLAKGEPIGAGSLQRAWRPILGLALTGVFFYNLCFFYGLKHVEAGRGALVVALNPVVVATLAWWLGGERARPPAVLGAVLAFVGCLTVIGNGDPLALLAGRIGLGEVLLLGCVVCWTAYTFVGRRATRLVSALAATFWSCTFGAVLLWAAAFAAGGVDWAQWSPVVWAAVAFLGVFGTAIGFTWYTDAVRVLGAARAAMFINLVPVAAVLMAAIALGETFAPSVALGGAAVLAGVWLTTRR